VLVALAGCGASPRVVIETAAGPVGVAVEIADTPAERARGLQYRRELGEREGMLFVFPSEERHSFWMKNTLIPLDLIFIASDRTIVGIIERATPLSTASLSVESPSQFVLEVPGGFCRRHGVRVGQKVRFEGSAVRRASQTGARSR
jgi:uncharacterized membrane protein (UPF0127 family)